MADRQPQIFSL